MNTDQNMQRIFKLDKLTRDHLYEQMIQNSGLNKLQKKGGFDKHIIVDEVTAHKDNAFVDYYSSNPHKYSEITI